MSAHGGDLRRVLRNDNKETEPIMNTNRRARGRSCPGNQAGFALVLAILALMLLTFLGLTLAATSSTELQIATNYRWSQQAYYNAEAGLEVAKLIMSDWAGDFGSILPPPRAPWKLADVSSLTVSDPGGVDAYGNALRNYESSACDNRSGIGYGLVWAGGMGPNAPYQGITTAYGQPLNGAFTLWVRRPVLIGPDGTFSYLTGVDENRELIVTSEGVAPYGGQAAGAGQAFVNANQAVRVLETRLAKTQGQPPCPPQGGQIGGSSSGAGFGACLTLNSGSLAGIGAGGSLVENTNNN